MKLLWAAVVLPGMAYALLATNGYAREAAAPPSEADEKLPAALSKAAPETVADLKAIQDQVKAVLKKTMPATVAIILPDPSGRGSAAGSGVIISEDGYVLTAGHISQTPNQKCRIILPGGKTIRGETLGWNKSRDAGLIKITTEGKWPYAKLGDSSKLKVGDWCLTVGHPGGYKPGRQPVVRLGRIIFNNRQWVQTDTPLVGGDSGGPLFDLQGRVVGIHSWISQSISGNMHVPVNIYKEGWDRLVKGEEWGREIGGRERSRNPVHLGVAFDIDTNDLKIREVYPRTPASRAGLQSGDVLLRVDDTKLENRSDLMSFLRKKKPGDEVTFQVERDGKATKIVLTLGRPQSDE